MQMRLKLSSFQWVWTNSIETHGIRYFMNEWVNECMRARAYVYWNLLKKKRKIMKSPLNKMGISISFIR